MKSWKQYQEDAANYFRSIGLNASTDVTVKGVRTSHDIDVLVTSHYVGFDITWIVECKHWEKPVNKLHVLGLREIVSDIGADRGVLLSESGFQSGAVEAANLTNVQVTSLMELRESATDSIYSMRLRDLYDRTVICKELYWDIPKKVRIKEGIRPDVGADGYSGARVIDMCIDLLTKAFRGVYPFDSDNAQVFLLFGRDKQFQSPKEILEIVEIYLTEIERKLKQYKEKA